MKASIDSSRCQAYGTCADQCPSVFTLDEWGYAGVVGDGTVPAGNEVDAEAAASSCPEKAITITA